MLRMALRNLRRSWRDYLSYFISLACITTMLYLFIGLRYNPAISKAIDSRAELTMAGIIASVLILVIGFDFAWYSSDFFLRRRYREMGLYNLYGMSRKSIGAMIFGENLVLGLGALALGVGVGFLLSKLFVMAVLRIMGLGMAVSLSLEPEAVRDTALYFCALLVPVALRSSCVLARYELASLFRAEKAGQESPKLKPWLGIASALALMGGYALALSSNLQTVIVNFLVVATVTTIASYGVVHSFLPWAIRKLRNRRQLSWRGGRLIAWSQLEYRIRSNIKLFVNISITGSAAMIALGFGFNSFQLIESTSAKAQPWDLSFSSSTLQPALDERVVSLIGEHGLALAERSQVTMVVLPAKDNSYDGAKLGNYLRGDMESVKVGVLPESLLAGSQPGGLRSAGVSFVEEAHIGISPTAKSRTLTLGDGRALVLGNAVGNAALNFHGDNSDYLVFVDDGLYRSLASEPGAKKIYSYNYRVSDRESMAKLTAALRPSLDDYAFQSYEDLARYLRLFKLYLFLGFLVGLVFLGTTCSILFFKQMAETRADEERYRVLLNIGAPVKALSSVVALQTLPLFVIPLVLGMVHSLVALTTMGIVLQANFAVPIAITLSSFALIFLGLGALTTRSYRKAVLRPATA